MTKFATFKETGFVEVLYDDAMDTVPVPPGAVQITDDEWLQIAMRPDLWKLENGVVVACEPPVTSEDINRERQRRIVAGKTINGIAVTGRDEDARNLTNLALAAQLRLASADTTTLTTFRDGNNTDHDLTPPEMLALWQGSAAYVSALYAASWVIKALDPIPVDYADDARWP